MPHKIFAWFIMPSVLAMLLFIALPIVSVIIQSLHVEHDRILVEVENCGPFGCQKEMRIDTVATAEQQAREPLGRFNGLNTYFGRNHLATAQVGAFWQDAKGWGHFFTQLLGLPFYKALSFTLAYSLVVTPFVLILGFLIALAVNSLPMMVKAIAIFISLLPMIITPLVGSLILFWMIDANGIIGASLQYLFNDPSLSLKASAGLTWVTLFVYGIWHSAPFAFVVFYAGLQTVPRDTLESAMIDGASRWERVRYVVMPHLAPLLTFVAMIQLMDNFRVFEPIVGFNAEASATSLSWLIYNNLRGAGTPLYGSAGAISTLTLLGISVLLTPVVLRTWREFNLKRQK